MQEFEFRGPHRHYKRTKSHDSPLTLPLSLSHTRSSLFAPTFFNFHTKGLFCLLKPSVLLVLGWIYTADCTTASLHSCKNIILISPRLRLEIWDTRPFKILENLFLNLDYCQYLIILDCNRANQKLNSLLYNFKMHSKLCHTTCLLSPFERKGSTLKCVFYCCMTILTLTLLHIHTHTSIINMSGEKVRERRVYSHVGLLLLLEHDAKTPREMTRNNSLWLLICASHMHEYAIHKGLTSYLCLHVGWNLSEVDEEEWDSILMSPDTLMYEQRQLSKIMHRQQNCKDKLDDKDQRSLERAIKAKSLKPST